jgi:hypothetical protein
MKNRTKFWWWFLYTLAGTVFSVWVWDVAEWRGLGIIVGSGLFPLAWMWLTARFSVPQLKSGAAPDDFLTTFTEDDIRFVNRQLGLRRYALSDSINRDPSVKRWHHDRVHLDALLEKLGAHLWQLDGFNQVEWIGSNPLKRNNNEIYPRPVVGTFWSLNPRSGVKRGWKTRTSFKTKDR